MSAAGDGAAAAEWSQLPPLGDGDTLAGCQVGVELGVGRVPVLGVHGVGGGLHALGELLLGQVGRRGGRVLLGGQGVELRPLVTARCSGCH